MFAGEAILMVIDGAKAKLKSIPQVKNLARVQASSSWLVSQKSVFLILAKLLMKDTSKPMLAQRA
jgi:hypothetical protein